MVTDHTGVNKSATDLVAKLKVTPQDNPTSQSLKADGDKNLADLKTLKGAAFDKAYVDHEVAYHQQVIDALDKTLIPGATNEELKALLVKVRPAFVAHLEHAKRLQSCCPQRLTVRIATSRRGESCYRGHGAVVVAGRRAQIEDAHGDHGEHAFSARTLTVARGDTVVWVNKDLVPHTATSEAGASTQG